MCVEGLYQESHCDLDTSLETALLSNQRQHIIITRNNFSIECSFLLLNQDILSTIYEQNYHDGLLGYASRRAL